jgi:phosphatidyl-myo-inositol dimannoside synthase
VKEPVRHLLVTNDFPPKVGGIQSYLWELWRRLDPDSYVVLTASSHPDAATFDAEAARAGIRITRAPSTVLLPTPATVRQVRRVASKYGARFVVVDPALPLGLAGPAMGLPYAVVLHGAEVTVPGRLPLFRQALARVLGGAQLAVCAGHYPAVEGGRAAGTRMPPIVEVPPGVDTARFVPLDPASRALARAELALPEGALVVLSVSRLVPRKGMDVLVDAVGELAPSFPSLVAVVGGEGRERRRLEGRARRVGAPVRFLGRVPDERLPRLYGAADIFAMACRSRWLGLEQEGFGIVFLEASAAGVPQVAGRSGGADEAVEHSRTGLVVDDPAKVGQVALALRTLLADPVLRLRMGEAARHRTTESFDYDVLAPRLAAALSDVPG